MSKQENEQFKFDVVIGNPPYQEELESDNDNYARPIYPEFMEEAFKISNITELITPARFLFNAGATSKAWNKKMLSSEHLKVLFYEADSSKVFENTDIKGGIVVTSYNNKERSEPITVFTPFLELGNIARKVIKRTKKTLDEIVYLQNKFNLDKLYEEFPQFKKIIGSDGKDKRFRNNIFDKVNIFTEKRDNEDDLKILGVIKNKRVSRYIPKRFVSFEDTNLEKYKVLVPRSNGSGALGEVLSTPLIGEPLIGFTQTFMSFGYLDTQNEAENLLKYVKSKFARTMLGILKVTQDNPRSTWKYVPLQDFTPNSDIDWTKSIPEIDQQLYRKYGLSQEEIDFIETHVKEMN